MYNEEFKEGIEGRAQDVVMEEHCAKIMGSGELMVYATPALVALCEKAAWTSVAPFLEEGLSTVGIHMSFDHKAASPIGMTITAESVLMEIDERRLIFKVMAYDETGLIGEGWHERMIINTSRFMEKALKGIS